MLVRKVIMKKISLTIVALLSLAMLVACSKHQTEETVSEASTEEVVETTESSEVSTAEEITEDTETNDDGTVVYDGSIVKNTDHPDYNPYYRELLDQPKVILQKNSTVNIPEKKVATAITSKNGMYIILPCINAS